MNESSNINYSEELPPAQALYDLNHLLLLFLGIQGHGNIDGLGYLSVPDLAQLPCLCRALNQHFQTYGVDYTRCRDGKNYRVPYPGFPGLFQTLQDTQDGITRGLFPHQLASLSRMHQLENPTEEAQFGHLRGGILGDAPGLGKTVTTLALIASTAGKRPLKPEWNVDPDKVRQGWRDLVGNAAYEYDLNIAMKPIREWTQILFQRGQLFCKILGNSVSLGDFSHCLAFVRHVKQSLRRISPLDRIEHFAENMDSLASRLDKSKRSFLASPAGQRYALERSLLTTSATLIVVPDALLEHWFEQTLHHLQLTRFVSSYESTNTIPRGVVYLDGIGDIADATVPLTGRVRLDHEMPKAPALTGYLIVVTTFHRCQREYRLERRAMRLKLQNTSHSSGSSNNSRKRPRRGLSTSFDAVGPSALSPVSQLLQLRWLRLIVDEGHELGGYRANTRPLTAFLHEIAAERRWVLSGTPTTGDQDSSDYTESCLDQLQRLLCFLRHPTYGSVPNRQDASSRDTNLEQLQETALQEWDRSIKQPFLERCPLGREKLVQVLKDIMVLHQKEHIRLPRPVFKQGEVSVKIPENEQLKIASSSPSQAQRMLDKYLHSDEYQSMVDEAQGKYIVESIQRNRFTRNIQRSKTKQFRESLENGSVKEYDESTAPSVDLRPVKAVVYSSSNNILLSVEEFLRRDLQDENIAVMYTGDVGDMSSELSRFRKGIKRVVTCPICLGKTEHSFNGREPHCRRTLIEVLTDERHGCRRILIEPERVVRAVPPPLGNVGDDRMGDILHTQYWQAEKKWRVGDILEVDLRDPHPILPRRKDISIWQQYGSDDCFEHAINDAFYGQDWFFGPLAPSPENENESKEVKAVLKKWQPCGKFHNPKRWYKGPLFKDAPVEHVKEDVFVLCLNSQVSHGLDLSFVTHIYLLEPIEDAGLLQQVTSRAHRLGATGPVIVETVNVWQDMSEATKDILKKSQNESSIGSYVQEHQTDKAICGFCCRSFPSLHLAEEHERTTCLQNPDSTAEVDNFSLSSVYRQIRPPPALSG